MNTSRGKILVIDDDPFFLKLLSDAFEENGFTVFCAGDGVEGVRLFMEKAPDAVLSDLVMPRKGGVSTLMEITSLAGENAPVVALLTSMIQETPHEHEEPDMGARLHIPKSTNPMDIVIIIEQLLERRKYQQN